MAKGEYPMELNIVTLIISMVLFFVLFFGIGILLNMLLKMSWVMAIIYPIIALLIVDEVRFIEYFRNSKASFSELADRLSSLASADILILSSGLGGALLAGIVIKLLRKSGYNMF
jgi:ABC-type multidrug transport system fused ATPase/permease subunit